MEGVPGATWRRPSHVRSLDQDPEALAAFREMGVSVLMSGRIGDNTFYYMDTEPLLGTIYELIGH
jgi:hypothetical protein